VAVGRRGLTRGDLRRLGVAALGGALLALAGYVGLAFWTLHRLADGDDFEAKRAAGLYDRDRVRASLSTQIGRDWLPDEGDGGMYTRARILDALVTPRGIHMLSLDPHGQWILSAASALGIAREQGSMPISFATPKWRVRFPELGRVEAFSAAGPHSHRYTLQWQGTGWVLTDIRLGQIAP